MPWPQDFSPLLRFQHTEKLSFGGLPMNRAEKLESLQIGRGVAAMLVILVHLDSFIPLSFGAAFADRWFIAGFAGVDFFFVLSGFIIWHRHAADIGWPERLVDYGWRRLVRIYPVYWIVTVVLLAVYFLVPRYGLGDETSPYIITTSLLLIPTYRAPIIFSGWTLVHEVWFYLLFAGLIAVRGRWFRWLVGGWVAVATGFALSVWPLQIIAHDPWLKLVCSPLNWEFALGCLAAWWLRRAVPSVGCCRVLLALGVVSLAAYLCAMAIGLRFHTVRELICGLSSFLIVLGAAGWELGVCSRAGGVAPRMPRALVFLGDASYAIYLLHGPALSATFKLAVVTGLDRRLGVNAVGWITFAVCLVVGCAFHQWVEQPLLRWLRGLRRPVPKPATEPASP